MWSIGVILLSALLCKSSFGVPANREVDGARTKFTDLNNDVLAIILDYVYADFTNLLRATQAMPWLSPYAAEVVRRRNYQFEIKRAHKRDPRIIGVTYTDDSDLKTTYDGHILLVKNETVLSVLKLLGSGIQHLTIDNTWLTTDESDLNPAITQYTSDSLKTLRIFNMKEESFKDMTAPFTKLEELSFVMRPLKGAVITPMPLNQLFPQLRRVQMFLYQNVEFMDYEFPNLEHAEISFNGKGWHEVGHLKGFVAKNPQVRSVILWESPKETLKRLHKHWPNLENLTIEVKDIGDHAVHFNNLKHLHLRSNYHCQVYQIDKISSSSLESLSMEYEPKFADKWNEFIDRHNSLTHLVARIGWEEQIPGLAELTTRMHNLVEMKVHSFRGFTVESIERIVQTHVKLLKFRLEPDFFPKWNQNNGEELLQEKFGNEWNVKTYTFKRGDSDRTGYLLTRKTSELEN